jgi:hypothetical protein
METLTLAIVVVLATLVIDRTGAHRAIPVFVNRIRRGRYTER